MYISVSVLCWYREQSGGPSSSRSPCPGGWTTRSRQSPMAAPPGGNGSTSTCKQSAHSLSLTNWGGRESQSSMSVHSVLVQYAVHVTVVLFSSCPFEQGLRFDYSTLGLQLMSNCHSRLFSRLINRWVCKMMVKNVDRSFPKPKMTSSTFTVTEEWRNIHI